MNEWIIKLLDSNLIGREIKEATGVSESLISKLRLKQRHIDTLSVDTAEKLYTFAKQAELLHTFILFNEESFPVTLNRYLLIEYLMNHNYIKRRTDLNRKQWHHIDIGILIDYQEWLKGYGKNDTFKTYDLDAILNEEKNLSK